MKNDLNEVTDPKHLQEISQQEFCDHIEDDDFFLAYGNPVVINAENGRSYVAMAWPLAERMLRATGRGDEVDEVIRQAKKQHNHEEPAPVADEKIKYWMYEFEMSDEARGRIEDYCALHELTLDEFFEEAVSWTIEMAENDPEGFKKLRDEMRARSDADYEIRLVRYYPVYKGETEAMALKRTLAEEKRMAESETGAGKIETDTV